MGHRKLSKDFREVVEVAWQAPLSLQKPPPPPWIMFEVLKCKTQQIEESWKWARRAPENDRDWFNQSLEILNMGPIYRKTLKGDLSMFQTEWAFPFKSNRKSLGPSNSNWVPEPSQCNSASDPPRLCYGDHVRKYPRVPDFHVGNTSKVRQVVNWFVK